MIEVILVTNGHPIRRVAIYNRGPAGGADGASYERGDGPGGDGLRRYEWRVVDDAIRWSSTPSPPTAVMPLSGEVLHRRGDGADQLCADVLEAVARQGKLVPTNERADAWQVDDPEG
jgi:hypothetical protein